MQRVLGIAHGICRASILIGRTCEHVIASWLRSRIRWKIFARLSIGDGDSPVIAMWCDIWSPLCHMPTEIRGRGTTYRRAACVCVLCVTDRIRTFRRRNASQEKHMCDAATWPSTRFPATRHSIECTFSNGFSLKEKNERKKCILWRTRGYPLAMSMLCHFRKIYEPLKVSVFIVPSPSSYSRCNAIE